MISAGYLLEKAGLKGELFHGMRVCGTAALVLINESAETYANLDAARKEICEIIYDKFGFSLEQEPVEIPERQTMTKELNGRELASFVKERQAELLRERKKEGKRAPKLLILRDSDNPVIVKYVNLKKRYGEDIGVEVEDRLVQNNDELKNVILEANKDTEIDGMIVQLPLKDPAKTEEIVNLIEPVKDMDGLADNEKPVFESATATAINWLLAGNGVDLKNGQKNALVGYGRLVGRPLERMWGNSGIKVDVFRHDSNLAVLKDYDVIVSATGVPHLIKSEMVKAGAVVVDAGTASENGVLVGDVDEEVRERQDLSAITPKVGGVGPLTVSVLFDNVIRAANQYYVYYRLPPLRFLLFPAFEPEPLYGLFALFAPRPGLTCETLGLTPRLSP